MTVIRKTKYKNKKYSRKKSRVVSRYRLNKFQKGSGEHMNLPSQNIQKRKEAEQLKLQEQIRERAMHRQSMQPVQPVMQQPPVPNKEIISKIKFALMQR
jgi:hypothetical protein